MSLENCAVVRPNKIRSRLSRMQNRAGARAGQLIKQILAIKQI